MFYRFIVSLALMLAPHHERNPLAGLDRATPRNIERCFGELDAEAWEKDRGCQRMLARGRVEYVYRLIEEHADTPEQAAELRRICARESWCGRSGFMGVHEDDAKYGRGMWSKAVARGLIHPDECPEHAIRKPSAWAPRGLFATSPAYVLRYFPGCNGPDILDDPPTAVVAARDHLRHLDNVGEDTCLKHFRKWVGPGKFGKWSRAKQVTRARRQCGEESTLTVLAAALADSVDEEFNLLRVSQEAYGKWTR